MIIYKDIITGDEMFSDAFPIKEVEGGFMYEVEGKRVCRTDSIDDSLLGANPSAEEMCESSDSATSSGVDIILNHKLQQTNYDRKQYLKHIKEYMKELKSKLEKDKPEKVDEFTKGMQLVVQRIVKNIKNYEFYTGESMNPDGLVALLDYREDGITPFMLFFKDGLEVEKF
ncbi:translationally-controlled tumor protein homolog [Hippoglossus stenolepis]|uniref:translationally-controlled tumor protein homolog n=1 Tax=Hippoglossus stenolepis TaxID=195615 RepID=UPI00159BF842|nr:translationally-controlled tumor protein homolog [Hippoglossus stenolepis]